MLKLLQLAAALVLEQAEGHAHEMRRAELKADLLLVEELAQGDEVVLVLLVLAGEGALAGAWLALHCAACNGSIIVAARSEIRAIVAEVGNMARLRAHKVRAVAGGSGGTLGSP